MKNGFGKKSLSLLLALALCLTLLPFAALAEDAAVEDVPVIEAIPAAAAIETAPAETPAAPVAPKAELQGGTLNRVEMFFNDLNRPGVSGYGTMDGYLATDAEGAVKFDLSGGVQVESACELTGLNLVGGNGTVIDLLDDDLGGENHCEVTNNQPGEEEFHYVNVWLVDVTIPNVTVGDYRLQIVTSIGTFVSEAYSDEWSESDGFVHIVNEIPAPTKPVITTTSLPVASVGSYYNETLTAEPVTPRDTITWSITAGALPEGLTLGEDGTLSGAPTTGGTYSFTVCATEAGFDPAERKLSLYVSYPSPTLNTRSLPDGKVGVPYTATLEATPYLAESTITWSLSESDAGIPGLTLAEDGTLSGTPTQAGSFSFLPMAYESGTGVSTGVRMTVVIAEGDLTITAQSVTARAGETVDVNLSIANNKGIAGALMEMRYDPALTLTAVKTGDALPDLTYTEPGDLTANPVKLLWDGLNADATNGTILTLTFTVSAEAADGEYAITLSCDPDGVYDGNMTDVPVTFVNGKVTVQNTVPGDVSGDGTVNAKDVTVLRRFIAGGYSLDVNAAATDVNKDGANNAKDVTVLRRYIAGGYGIVLS